VPFSPEQEACRLSNILCRLDKKLSLKRQLEQRANKKFGYFRLSQSSLA